MRSIFDLVIRPKESRKTNIKKLGESELLLSTDLQDHKYVNRIGVVIGVPKISCGDIKPGDEVLVHHNVFRRFYDVRGNEKNSSAYFDEDIYLCSPDQVYMYKRGGDWKPLDGFCFVKPIKSLNEMWTPNEEEPLMGVLKYLDNSLEEKGLRSEDIVGFTPRSEFEFIIDNNRMYRVPSTDISIKYERTGNEKEYNPSWAQSS
jgi:hypothetical protein